MFLIGVDREVILPTLLSLPSLYTLGVELLVGYKES
jgi:hypothetical protein